MFSSKLFRPAQQLSKVRIIWLVCMTNGSRVDIQRSLAD